VVCVASIAAGVLLLAGCSSGTEDTITSATASEVAESEVAASEVAESESSVAVATPLPVFSSTTLEGRSVTQADYEGKPTIMWFWAPWCSVCRVEAPTLSKVASELDGSIDVVGVAALGSVDEMKTFVSDTGIENFSQLADPDAEVWSVFGVAAQPAFAFIGADGSIEIVQGSLDENAILERAATLS
jgi:thiol-disulfide isomerase/thioredoxin